MLLRSNFRNILLISKYFVHDQTSCKIAPENLETTNITTLSATLNGSVNANYLSAVVTFEYGTTRWATPNTGASNESGFAALTGGYRGNLGEFINITKQGYWWSSTGFTSAEAYGQSMNYLSSGLSRLNDLKKYSLSVRCIKD